MSEIKQSIPYLSLSEIKALELPMLVFGGGEGWMLSNRHEFDEEDNSEAKILLFYIKGQKVKYQLKSIVNRLEKLQNMLSDFQNGELDKYIDEHMQWGDESVFDPYEELLYCLQTEGIQDLPDRIERFAELLDISLNASKIALLKEEMFEKILGSLTSHYRFKDADGEDVFVPESELPVHILEEIIHSKDVQERTQAIESEHCLDNYNAWLAGIKQAVSERRPFDEIQKYIKD
jgi:predicted RNA binding protein YcfA (HicA-like mRNA interferase family)